jgi:hypothetical protein
MNLVAYGNQNIVLNGNPSKTLFKCTYSKYTNFGLQKFRTDFDGVRTLNLTDTTLLDFKILRYADLLMDTYLVVTLPDIWSPILPPNQNNIGPRGAPTWRPYEFKWIKNVGSQMINKVSFMVGSQIIQEFSGQYLTNLVERDFSETKKKAYYNMTGNIPELNDPAISGSRKNIYPSAYNFDFPNSTIEPSIRSRQLYIPLNIWFTLSSKMAFPLTSLQYNELHVVVEIRPINDLFVVRNVANGGQDEYIKPTSSDLFNFDRFINSPPPPTSESGAVSPAPVTDYILDYSNVKKTPWNPDIHLISTYAFLTEDEVRSFASQEQRYLIKQVYEYNFLSLFGPTRAQLYSLSMVANWMWYFQRNDASERNEWSNYTNWPYDYLPFDMVDPYILETNAVAINYNNIPNITPGINPVPPTNNTGIWINPERKDANEANIMTKWSLLFDGKYRENEQDAGVYNLVEKYAKSSGFSSNGLYSYNFDLNTNPFEFQPSGAVNLSKINKIEFEFNTITPLPNEDAYKYNLHVMEERYNTLVFSSGNAALMYAR